MSRIGKLPIAIPEGVQVNIDGSFLSATGSKGTLERVLPTGVNVVVDSGKVFVRSNSNSRRDRSLHGLTRTLIANMVEGVSRGFERGLEISGVGYRAEVNKDVLVLQIGYSQPVEYKIPEDITIRVEKQVSIFISGKDKEKVGMVASQIRAIKKPEPYKGKGIRYANEVIKRKVGKSVGSK